MLALFSIFQDIFRNFDNHAPDSRSHAAIVRITETADVEVMEQHLEVAANVSSIGNHLSIAGKDAGIEREVLDAGGEWI